MQGGKWVRLAHLRSAFNLPCPVHDHSFVGWQVVLPPCLQHAEEVSLPVSLLWFLMLVSSLDDPRLETQKTEATILTTGLNKLRKLGSIRSHILDVKQKAEYKNNYGMTPTVAAKACRSYWLPLAISYWWPKHGVYLNSFLQHGRPFHDEITAHAGRPYILAGPDVAENVWPLRANNKGEAYSGCVRKRGWRKRAYLANSVELSCQLHNKYLTLHQWLLLLELHPFTRILEQRNWRGKEKNMTWCVFWSTQMSPFITEQWTLTLSRILSFLAGSIRNCRHSFIMLAAEQWGRCPVVQ